MLFLRSLTREFLPLVAATVALLVSLAAQYAWTLTRGPVAIVAGLFGPLALVLGARLWRRLRARGWLAHTAMAVIVTVAAVVTYVHTAWLLILHGEHVALAWILPAAIDGLAIMATLAIADRPQPVDSSGDDEADKIEADKIDAIWRDTSAGEPTFVERVAALRDRGFGRPRIAKELGARDWDVRKALSKIEGAS